MVEPRSSVLDLKICEHGGRSGANAGIIDFSASLNPYGPPDSIYAAIRKATEEIGLYPDNNSNELRMAISEKLGITVEGLLVGSGSTELIRLVAMTFVSKDVLIPKHTYGEYGPASEMMGGRVRTVDMPEMLINSEMIIGEISRGDVIFLCNPNNPTGQYLRKDDIKWLTDSAEDNDALLVIDEAYIDFVENAYDTTKLASDSENLIVLRSLTKSYAIPGIRLGYSIGSEANTLAIKKVKPPWNVDIFAQKVGVAAINDKTFLSDSKRKILTSKKKIAKRLNLHSDANFFIMDVGAATDVRSKLMNKGVCVRDCSSFGLPSRIRFSVRRDEENELLLRSIESLDLI
ncbi:MAG: histidinol-phosphate transaminase [Halobacteriota archaeon]|nr:histidinol-phosphate transaminase [Halobacteriota archaeon]